MSARKKALIIDDDETIQKLLIRLCDISGVDADAVCSFSELEEMFNKADLDYDIYFVDLILPQVSGWDIIMRLRELEQTRDKPVVVISGANISESERERLLQKANDVLLKQAFSLTAFKDVLTRFLGTPDC